MKRFEQIPDEIAFIDEDGNPLPEYGIWVLTPEHKTFVLERAIKWRQSIPITLERVFNAAIREYTGQRRLSSGVRYTPGP